MDLDLLLTSGRVLSSAQQLDKCQFNNNVNFEENQNRIVSKRASTPLELLHLPGKEISG